eukprot:5188135-Pyramimonas_sp.AAC.2
MRKNSNSGACRTKHGITWCARAALASAAERSVGVKAGRPGEAAAPSRWGDSLAHSSPPPAGGADTCGGTPLY